MLKNVPTGTHELKFSEFKIYDMNSQKYVITQGEGTSVKVETASVQSPPPSSGGSSGGGGGGGGSGSRANIVCDDYWSVCNTSLQQGRDCFSRNRKIKHEVRACQPCIESWVCSSWSNSEDLCGTRTCVDEHSCETNVHAPPSAAACPVPPQVQEPSGFNFIPPAFKEATSNFWDNNKSWLLWALGVLLAGIIIAVVLHFVHHKQKTVYNFDELKEWVRKEKELGTSNEDIKDILEQNTGWSEKEIEQSFVELADEPQQVA